MMCVCVCVCECVCVGACVCGWMGSHGGGRVMGKYASERSLENILCVIMLTQGNP